MVIVTADVPVLTACVAIDAVSPAINVPAPSAASPTPTVTPTAAPPTAIPEAANGTPIYLTASPVIMPVVATVTAAACVPIKVEPLATVPIVITAPPASTPVAASAVPKILAMAALAVGATKSYAIAPVFQVTFTATSANDALLCPTSITGYTTVFTAINPMLPAVILAAGLIMPSQKTPCNAQPKNFSTARVPVSFFLFNASPDLSNEFPIFSK